MHSGKAKTPQLKIATFTSDTIFAKSLSEALYIQLPFHALSFLRTPRRPATFYTGIYLFKGWR